MRPPPRLLLLLLALACASAVPVRPSLHGVSLLPAIARARRRGPAPLASAQASRPAASGKREVIDTATQLAASIATGQLTQAMQLKAMHDLPLNEEEYASLKQLVQTLTECQAIVRQVGASGRDAERPAGGVAPLGRRFSGAI